MIIRMTGDSNKNFKMTAKKKKFPISIYWFVIFGTYKGLGKFLGMETHRPRGSHVPARGSLDYEGDLTFHHRVHGKATAMELRAKNVESTDYVRWHGRWACNGQCRGEILNRRSLQLIRQREKFPILSEDIGHRVGQHWADTKNRSERTPDIRSRPA